MANTKGIIMKFTIVLMVIAMGVLLVLSGCGKFSDQDKGSINDEGVNALMLVPNNYGLNYQLLREAIDQYGWNIIHTGVSDTISACPPVLKAVSVPPIIPDLPISEITDVGEYDCLIIAPSTGNYIEIPDSHEDLIQSPEAMKLIRDAVKAGIPVFGMCAGVRVLAAAGVIDGKEITGSWRYQEEYKEAGATYLGKDNPPIIAGSIITSVRGQTNSVGNINAISAVMERQLYKTGEKLISDEQFIYSEAADFKDGGIILSKTYGGFASDGGHAVIETDDGGFLITGYTFSGGSGDADILVIKTDGDGEAEWIHTYGGKGMEYGYDCTEAEDGYLIVGYTSSFGSGSKDVYLLKIGKLGKVIWEKTCGGPGWDVGKSIAVSENNEYFICGFTHSFGEGEEDIYVIKVDSGGNEIWSKTFGGERLEMGNTIRTSGDGNFVIGATSGTFAGGNTDFYLLKIDADGNKIWDKAYQGESATGHGFDWCNSVELSSGGGYILTGYSDCNWLMDAYIQIVDSLGNDIWHKSVGPGFYHFANVNVETNSGQFVMCGATRSVDGNSDIYLVKLSADGKIEQQKNIAGPGHEYGRDICLTRDGNVALVGYTDSFGRGKFDVCLIKMWTSL
jgi:putative intracellular protease/amidase